MAALVVGSVIPKGLTLPAPKKHMGVWERMQADNCYPYTYTLYTGRNGVEIFREAMDKEIKRYEQEIIN